MKQVFYSIMLVLILASCNQDKPTQPIATTPPPATPAATLPSVPLADLEKLWQEGTQVDYIFYNYPFTMSLSEKPAVQSAVRHISEAPAPLKPECKAMGRVTYQIMGEITLEGEFFFNQGCTYFVFEKNRVKTYANYMTDDAIKYFNGQIQQAIQLQKQMEQGGAQQ